MRCCKIEGETTDKNRSKLVRAFEAGKYQVREIGQLDTLHGLGRHGLVRQGMANNPLDGCSLVCRVRHGHQPVPARRNSPRPHCSLPHPGVPDQQSGDARHQPGQLPPHRGARGVFQPSVQPAGAFLLCWAVEPCFAGAVQRRLVAWLVCQMGYQARHARCLYSAPAPNGMPPPLLWTTGNRPPVPLRTGQGDVCVSHVPQWRDSRGSLGLACFLLQVALRKVCCNLLERGGGG